MMLLALNRVAVAMMLFAASGIFGPGARAANPAPENLESSLEQFAGSGWREHGGLAGTGHLRKSQQQALFEQAELERTRGNFEQAGKILAGMDEGYWSAVGYLNLSSDYARNDLKPSRALVALRVALAMAGKDTDAQRKTALRARILLRAGYLAYSNSEYEKAIGFLEKIPLDNHKTPQALYFHGLALAEQGNHRAAMQSWHRAKKYPLAYPGVAESWVGMGRGYDLSGYLGQAGEAYLAANGAYESERVTLRKLAGQIKEQGAYRALVLNAQGLGSRSAEWFLADSRTLAQPRTAYLLRFMEQSGAQKAAGRVANLARITAQLERYVADLDIFIAALSGQLSLSGTKANTNTPERLNDKTAELKQRVNLLREREGSTGITQKQRLQIRAMEKTLADVSKQLGGFPARLAASGDRVKALLNEARELRKSSVAHLESAAVLQVRAKDELDGLALDFVADQDTRMVFALDKTEQQIAHLYEYLALQELDAGEREK